MLGLLLLVPVALLVYGCYLWMVSWEYRHLPGDLGSAFPIIGHLYVSLRQSFLSGDEINSVSSKLLKGTRGIACTFIVYKPCVVVSDPLIAEKLINHPAFRHKDPAVYESVPQLWRGPFSIADANKEWKMRRRELISTLKKSNLDSYHRTFVEVSQRMMEQLKKEKGLIDIQRFLTLASLDTIARTHHDYDIRSLDQDELYHTINWLEEKVSKAVVLNILAIASLMMSVHFPTKLRKVMNSVVLGLVGKRLPKIKKPDLTQENKDELYSDVVIRRNLSMNKSVLEMKPDILDLLFVGTHTSGTTSSAAAVYLAMLPEIQEKAWLEQREIFGDSNREPTIEDVRKMEYLERVLLETLRFMTAALSVRRLKTEVNIDGTIIPKGATVILCSYLMRMDERYWENPSRFDPDRHLKPIIFKNAHSFFGFRPRHCPGGRYALNAMKVSLSTLLREYEIVTDKKFEDIKLTVHLFMSIENGYEVSLIRRSK